MSKASGLDGARLAVLASRLEGVVQVMLHTLFHTARSGVINAAHDLSCCILTADHQLVASAQSLPIHVMRGPDIMSRSMTERHDPLVPGDAFLHNSPYHGCSHPADHSILVPVFDHAGNHRFTVLSKAHQADCGNSEPTTYAVTAVDVYEEGALIFPCVQIQRHYKDIQDIVEMCKMRIRVPEQWWGDYLALLGAARVGERELLRLGDELSWSDLEAFCTAWFDYSEAVMADAIRALPEGEVTVNTAHDPIPDLSDGIPISVTVRTLPKEPAIEVDLRNNIDCLPCGLNLTEATALTAAMTGIFNSIRRRVPPNAGSFRRLRILLRENCVVGVPRHPTSCSAATTNVASRVTNAVQSAFSKIGEGVGMAEVGLVLPPSVGVVSGRDPRRDQARFINQLFLLETGGGATPKTDGWLTTGHAGSAGMVHRDSVEMDELRLPLRVYDQRIIPDTEGAGRFRGAPSGRAEYGPVGGPIEVMFASDGNVNPPQGVRGGSAGAPADQYRRKRDGSLERLDACARITLEDGESIVSICCGGGGYGNPHTRDPERVRHDVIEGWITPERAKEVYGVQLDEQLRIDEENTAYLRRKQ